MLQRPSLSRALAAAMVLLVPTFTPAQTPAPAPAQDAPQGPTFRSGIDLTTVDVAVVDNRGLPVEDLRAPEFEVKIDGEVRRVVTAELVKVDPAAATQAADDKTETFYTSNMTPPLGRQIVIVVDQLNIRPGTLRPLMDAASRFLDRLSPLDQVAFITYPEPGPRVNFTSDKLRLRLAMQRLIGQQPRPPSGQRSIGDVEALAIHNRRDQLVLNDVMARECRNADPARLAQCERDIVAQASEMARRLREDADESLRGLQGLLERLAYIDGAKSVILISEGLAVDDQNELRRVVALAGAARAAINVMAVDLRRGDVSDVEQAPTGSQDRRLQMQGLEMLATMARGALFYIAGTGEPIFDRLASEISAYYLLGVEQRPADAVGNRHRIDVQVRRRNVTIRSRQAFVLSPSAGRQQSAEAHLREALSSPFGISGVPLRVTTFSHQDPAGGKVRVRIAAQIGQPGAQAAEFTVGYLVVNDQNQVVASYGAKQRLSPAGASPTDALDFLGGVVLDPGVYSLRFGVVDAEGRRGSVVRDVNAWKMSGEALALGDLIVGPAPEPGQPLRASVEPHVSADTLAGHVELYSNAAATFDRATVTFEVADDADAPALLSLDGQVAPGGQPTWRVATGLMGLRALPPGRYVARAQIRRDGKAVGVLARPFVLERGAGARTVSATAASESARAFAGTLPAFDRGAVLQRDLLASMLDAVERRSPALRDAMTEARAGRYGPAAVEALGAGDQTAAAFLRGLDLYAKGQLDQAVTQLNISAGPRREFFPAALLLGAALAAAGRDRDAAGVWQLAIGGEARPAVVYTMVADARLRDGQPQSAIDILKPAYDRQPGNDDIGRRLAVAYVLTARYADAVPLLDAYLVRHPADQDLLLAAVVAVYEWVRGGQVLSEADLAKVRRYAAAYTGTEAALVSKYVQTLQAR